MPGIAEVLFHFQFEECFQTLLYQALEQAL
jgi:hypothetical protein